MIAGNLSDHFLPFFAVMIERLTGELLTGGGKLQKSVCCQGLAAVISHITPVCHIQRNSSASFLHGFQLSAKVRNCMLL